MCMKYNFRYCDDDNNNEECGWDGGACCGNDVLAFFCSDCSCLDPNAPDRYYYLMNFIFLVREFPDTVEKRYLYKMITLLHNPASVKLYEILIMLFFPLLNRPEDACGSPQWFNDTYCDDDNNNEECGWDGGDCCGDDIKTGT